MTTHVRSAISSPLSALYAAIRAGFKAWRQQRAEQVQIEALEALGPEVLDDIGIKIVKDKPTNFVPVYDPYGIVASAVFAPKSSKRDY